MVRKMEALESRQLASPVHKNPNLKELYELCEKKAQVSTCTLSMSLLSPRVLAKEW